MKFTIIVVICLGFVTLVFSECSPECLRCNSESACLECPKGLDPVGPGCLSVLTKDDFDADGVARKACFDSRCKSCPVSTDVCEECVAGYLVQKGECTRTKPPDCESSCKMCVDDGGPYCLKCYAPRVAENGKCTVHCEDTCTNCIDQAGPWCTACITGYHTDNGNCVADPVAPVEPAPAPKPPPKPVLKPLECKVRYCDECHANAEHSCLRCVQGFESDGTGGCQAICQVEYCARCAKEDGSQCVLCQPNFEIESDGRCITPCEVPNCLVCFPGRSDVCLSCQDPYMRDEKTMCKVPQKGCWDKNCVDCAETDENCSNCLLGWMSVENECIKTETNCDDQCLDCFVQQSGPMCLRCGAHMRPENDECKPDRDDVRDSA